MEGLSIAITAPKAIFNGFGIFIKTLTGKIIPVQVNDAITVDRLKMKIAIIEGIPADRQRLIFNRKQMEDGEFLRFKRKSVC